MNPLDGIKLREGVQLAGIPVVWNTNLSDEDVRDFYQGLVKDRDYLSFIRRKDGPLSGGAGFAISISTFSKAIDFKVGHCQCFGGSGKLWLIYRTTVEWDLLEAREREISELREEQEQQRKVEQLICENEDSFLREKTATQKLSNSCD